MPYLGLRERSLVAAITISSGMGFILFGYDNGVIGGLLTQPSFEALFKLSATMQGTVTALFEIGCLIGCLMTALNADYFGRLSLAHAGAFIICLGAILQASSYSVAQLIVGRIVAGVGLGLISSNVVVWQSETAPKHLRGALVACSLSFLIVGTLIAYWTDYGMNTYTGSVSWRFPMAFQAFIALMMSILLFFMPESPRWLMLKERYQEAHDIIKLLKKRDTDEGAISADLAEIREAIALESNQRSWFELFKDDKVKSRRRVILACTINFMQAWSGSTPVSYYTTVIFEESIGFSRHFSLLMSGFLQIWFLIASIATWWLIEHVGRRRMFMVSGIGMAVVMAILGAMIAVNTHTSGIVAAIMLFAYQSLFTWGWMGGVWCYGPEILPLDHRSKGVGLATANQWIWNFVVLEIVPIAIQNIGWKIYIIFAAFNLAWVPLIYFFFPETAGLNLEMIDLAFMDRTATPVKRAKELRRIVKVGETLTLREHGDGLEKGTVSGQHIEIQAE